MKSKPKPQKEAKVRIKAIIMGAAGRDFHNFNVFFRNNPYYDIVCFTAAQIPQISNRTYPSVLAGKLYKKGIPIFDEKDLPALIKKHGVKKVFFSYSDVTHDYVMHKVSIAQSCGASLTLLGPRETMLRSTKPVVAVTAVRTGCGKSQVSRKIAEILKAGGKKAVLIRHPMPYGDLAKQACQRFESIKDLKKYRTTIEEREEYEPIIMEKAVVYAGVDYEKILRKAEKEADVIIWDGGNNDFPFYYPNAWIVVADPFRPGHELSHYPGETNFRAADAILINKENTAPKKGVDKIMQNAFEANPSARIIHADSAVKIEGSPKLKGKKAIVVEDGPTVTHGGMGFGAGYIAAKKAGAKIVSPKKFAVGSIAETYAKYPHVRDVLPAMGYYGKQLRELQMTINDSPAECVVSGTPINLKLVMKVNKPMFHVRYWLEEKGNQLQKLLKDKGIIGSRFQE